MPDDLSHLIQLGTQREEVQSESQESDREVDQADMARDLSVKKPKIVKYRVSIFGDEDREIPYVA